MSALDPNAFDRVLDEYYPRDENGNHYIPRGPTIDFSLIRKAEQAKPREWVKPYIPTAIVVKR